MAGERNLGRGRATKRGSRTTSRLNPQSARFSAQPSNFGKVVQRRGVASVTTGTRTTKVTTGKIKLPRARTTAANIGRSANFAAPRGSRGGAKWHGK